jgi:hypothetical protein
MTTDLELASRSLEAWAAEAEAAAGIARQLVTTAFFPDTLRVRDEDGRVDLDASVAQGAAALLTGQEVGLSPMASFRSIDVIPPGSGSPAIRANAMRALAIARGHEIWPVEMTDTRCVMRGRRADANPADPPTEVIWTIDRAAKLRPRGFGNPDSGWKRQPRTMLIARATAETVRLVAPEVLLGLPYAAEELLDEAGPGAGSDDGQEPAALSAPAGAAPARTVRRSRPPTRRRTALAALPSPSDAAPSREDGDGAASSPAAPPPPRINPAQRAKLWAGLRRLGLTERDPALGQLSTWLGRDLDSTSGLTEAEADDVLDKITAEERRREARQAAEDAQAQAAAEDAQAAAALAEEEAPPDD